MSDDILLIKQYQGGNFDSFARLYDKYIDQIYRFIYLKTSNKESSEDLTSEVFMKAMRWLEKVQAKLNFNFKSWLYTVARNTVIDFYRNEEILSEVDANQDVDSVVAQCVEILEAQDGWKDGR